METPEKGVSMFKINSKLPEWPQWHRSGVFIVNFEHTLHLTVFLLLTLSRYLYAENSETLEGWGRMGKNSFLYRCVEIWYFMVPSNNVIDQSLKTILKHMNQIKTI